MKPKMETILCYILLIAGAILAIASTITVQNPSTIVYVDGVPIEIEKLPSTYPYYFTIMALLCFVMLASIVFYRANR